MRYVSATPAYGVDYKTKAQVLAAWNSGADFRIRDPFLSGYVNKNDKPADIVLNIRYDRLMKITPVR